MTADRTEANREYLIREAAQHDWRELWPRVMQGRAALLEALAGVSAAQATWRPPSGDGEDAWSTVEVARHVLTYTRNVVAIIEGTARGESVPKDPPGAIHDVGDADLSELYGVLVEASTSLAALHRNLPAQPNLEVRVPHPSIGPLNSREWYLFFTVHDGAHSRQIVALKAHAGFPQGHIQGIRP
jgi:DinB superfamily